MAEPAPAFMDLAQCGHCSKTAADTQTPLKKCSKCRITSYCSRECQTADWALHGRVCRSTTPNTPPVQQSSTNNPQNSPHSMWDTKSWLSSLPEKECYEAISYAWRLHMDDENIHRGAREFVILDFMIFLAKARDAGILPDRCMYQKVIDMAADETEYACVYRAMERENFPERYRDPGILEKLRMLAARVHETPVELQ